MAPLPDVWGTSCGIVAAANVIGTSAAWRDSIVHADVGKLNCSVPYISNCSSWDHNILRRLCPQDCPYLAQIRPLGCAFACVGSESCHVWGSAPFANPDTGRCEPSSVEACEVASGPLTCTRCRPHFALALGGKRCVYQRYGALGRLVQGMNGILHHPAFWAAMLLGISVLLRALKLGASANWDIIALAQTHRRLCKVRQSPKVRPQRGDNNDNKSQGAPLYSLFANVHTQFMVGLGLPLYYNSLVFLFLLSLVLYVGVLRMNSAEDAVFVNVHGMGDPSTCAAAFLSSPAEDIEDASRRLMKERSMGALELFLAALVLTLLHAWHQLRHAEWFEDRHMTPKDFAVKLSGFPPEATDETEIKESLTAQLKARVPNVRIEAVSIAYDFWDKRDEVDALINRHLTYVDFEARTGTVGSTSAASRSRLTLPQSSINSSSPAGLGIPPMPGEDVVVMAGPRAVKLNLDRDRQRVRSWFGPAEAKAGRITATGIVFVVFTKAETRRRVLQELCHQRSESRLRLQWRAADGNEYPLRAAAPKYEPTSIRWKHLAFSRKRRIKRLLCAMCIWLTVCSMLALFVFLPFAMYNTSYVRDAGTQPSGLTMTVLGILNALACWQICVLLAYLVERIGLHTAEDETIVIFIAFTSFCVSMAVYNVCLTWYSTAHIWSNLDSEVPVGQSYGKTLATLRAVEGEDQLGASVFRFLVPGALFTPSLMWPFNGFVWPYICGLVQLMLCGKGRSGREVEQKLEPLPIGLPWDYQGHVTLPACCLLTLFILSPSTSRSFGYLCGWCVFFYCFQRCMHLRAARKAFFTTSQLDRVVLYTWGLVLAELAMCHAYWKHRLHEWHFVAMPLAFASALLLYWLLLRFLMGLHFQPSRAQSHTQLDSALPEVPAISSGGIAHFVSHAWGAPVNSGGCRGATREELCYDWLNVNPVHVLKSQYCNDSKYLKGKVFYDPGKEYLQVGRCERSGPRFSNEWWHVRGEGWRWEVEDAVDILTESWDRFRRAFSVSCQPTAAGSTSTMANPPGRSPSGGFLMPLPRPLSLRSFSQQSSQEPAHDNMLGVRLLGGLSPRRDGQSAEGIASLDPCEDHASSNDG